MRPAADPPLPRELQGAAKDKQKRTFLRMVSHELRTPLNSILGFSEILAGEAYGPLGAPQYKQYAEIIRDSGQKLLKLVNQLLEIARLEVNAIEWDLRPEPLQTAIEEVLENLDRDIVARQLDVVCTSDTLPDVIADSNGLRTVLQALIHNAVVFSPEGREIQIGAHRRGEYIGIEIHNEIEGMDFEDLPQLLDPVERGSLLTRSAAGAGLGLSICALTCQAMGGRLTLDSGTHTGVTAYVRLPAA